MTHSIPHRRARRATALVASLLLCVAACPLAAQGTVSAHTKITEGTAGFSGCLDKFDHFAVALVGLGDIDDDGVADLAVGARGDDELGTDRGSVWVLRLQPSGNVKSTVEINDALGGLGGGLDDLDNFGISLAGLGDLDGDGVEDMAVGAHGDDDGGSNRGAVWIVLLHPTGTVKARQKISSTQGGFGAGLDDGDRFGISLAAAGDLDGDGVPDLVVGASFDDDGGADRGALWILNLNPNGTVKAKSKISDTLGGFAGALANADQFGRSVAALGDADGDGIADLAVGAQGDDDGASGAGAAWVLLMNGDGTVRSQQKISALEGGFTGSLDVFDAFGSALAPLGDLDGDGVVDLAVGAMGDDDAGGGRGAFWNLFLKPDGSVKALQKVSDTSGGFAAPLANLDEFGIAITSLGDINGDGVVDLAVGADKDDECNDDYGAAYVLFMNASTSSWHNLAGPGLAGTHGVPTLVGTGDLSSGSLNALDLTHAASSSTAALFVALSSTPVAFKGGTLTPFPLLVPPIFIPTSGAGSIPLSFSWPAGVPSGTQLWFQWAIQDAATVEGASLSNAVRGVTP